MIFFIFTPIPGEMIQFDENYNWWFNHQIAMNLRYAMDFVQERAPPAGGNALVTFDAQLAKQQAGPVIFFRLGGNRNGSN